MLSIACGDQSYAVSSKYDVFISYSRSTSIHFASNLHTALDNLQISTFLDTTNIKIGETFPVAIAQALLSAKVAVIFVDDAYFRRWHCLRELLMIRGYSSETQTRT